MKVSLTPDLEQFVADKVKSGRYTSANEVIRGAPSWGQVLIYHLLSSETNDDHLPKKTASLYSLTSPCT